MKATRSLTVIAGRLMTEASPVPFPRDWHYPRQDDLKAGCQCGSHRWVSLGPPVLVGWVRSVDSCVKVSGSLVLNQGVPFRRRHMMHKRFWIWGLGPGSMEISHWPYLI